MKSELLEKVQRFSLPKNTPLSVVIQRSSGGSVKVTPEMVPALRIIAREQQQLGGPDSPRAAVAALIEWLIETSVEQCGWPKSEDDAEQKQL